MARVICSADDYEVKLLGPKPIDPLCLATAEFRVVRDNGRKKKNICFVQTLCSTDTQTHSLRLSLDLGVVRSLALPRSQHTHSNKQNRKESHQQQMITANATVVSALCLVTVVVVVSFAFLSRNSAHGQVYVHTARELLQSACTRLSLCFLHVWLREVHSVDLS